MPTPTHVRAQISDKVIAALTGLPTTGANVFKGRTRPMPRGSSRVLLVYARSEKTVPDAMGIMGRALLLRIEGRVTMAGPPDDVLDTIALEVEPAMVADFTLGGLAREVTLVATTIDAVAPGDTHAGEIAFDYHIFYRTRENAPDTAV